MSASDPEMFVDHANNLSSLKKSVLCLSFVLFLDDCPYEVRVRDDHLQSRRNLRIKHLKVRESTPFNWLRRHKIVHWCGHLYILDPQHSIRKTTWTRTHFGLEIRLPTLKCRRIRQLTEMQFWELIPRQFNHTILRTSSFCLGEGIPGWKLPCKSRSWNCEILRVSYQFICSLGRSLCIQRHGFTGCWCHTSRISKESCWWFTRGR